MPSMTDRLMRLRPVQFRYKAQDDSLEYELVAEEVAEVEPGLVNPEGDHVYYRKVNAMLLKAVQELTARVEELEQR